ncbi:class I SAM-dependent methyltransferase [Balneolaceae bacterium YR4-1]|uniref:Class I SAM-dependent methyltransferase n=1 Tax=Halalkalibaculum roseum TaxID=2709311 RepID=A0A6M1STN5_9BACT|nr:class I SAM-dependent methyltransferase [Halalkalibaculum roseum]NGP75506.1 class I SAM-dependent methyltransferase [Halalkalibaculum roseum]
MTHYSEEAFNRKAKRYEHRWEAYLNHTHEIFLKHIEIEEGETLLDVSSGTGLLALELTELDAPFEKLVLNDPSKTMLEFAQKRLADHPKITFSNQTAEKLEFDDRHFDRIFCLNAFHFYSNQKHALEHFHSLLKPGGRVYILDWNRSGFFRFVNKVITWWTTENINTRSFVEMQDQLNECGFQMINVLEWSWRYWNFFFIEAKLKT